METIERIETVPVEAATPFLQWTPVVAGALVAAAVSVILIAFGSAIGFSIASSSPTWRDASPALALASGLYLLLTALLSFGFGGYMAGRLRERWTTSAHSDVVESAATSPARRMARAHANRPRAPPQRCRRLVVAR